ncbi:MAG: hypothetical protein IJV06_07765 [Bacteroidaceae bacterium]|nr:hypothetical protein [Bacteroidaceae bacterium]
MNLQQAKTFYVLLSRNQRLRDRRHPMFEKNMAMRVFGYIFVAFWAVYLMMLGFVSYQMFDGGAMEAFDVVDGGMIFILALDFLLRFFMQETPAQDIKPYKLVPIPTRFLLNVFLLRMGLRIYNFFWFFFLIPFGLFAVVKYYGFIGLLSYLLGWWFLFVVNSYWYLLCRTFVNRNVYFFLVPLLVYAVLIFFGIFGSQPWLFNASVWVGRLFVTCSPLMYGLFFAVVTPLFLLNRKLQKASIYAEISKAEKVVKVKSREMHALDRFGEVGEYLKLEIKSTMRNSVIRKQFLTGFYCMLLFCLLFAFTDVYDTVPFMRIYICVYCFSCIGVMTLTVIMCAEGNYIDGLMSRKESILSLLKAKYYFNCALMLVPLLISLFPIVKGKMTVIDALGCMFFTSGMVMPFLFQLAAYNDSTINLNQRLTKGGHSTKAQMLFSSVALFLPMLVMYALVSFWDEQTASLTMMVIGIVGTALHPLWLRNIYGRFMKRRHAIMDGFRNSR